MVFKAVLLVTQVEVLLEGVPLMALPVIRSMVPGAHWERTEAGRTASKRKNRKVAPRSPAGESLNCFESILAKTKTTPLAFPDISAQKNSADNQSALSV